MIKIEIELTRDEMELLKSVMEKSTDMSDFRETWKSRELKDLESKVKSSVIIAEQKISTEENNNG